MSSIDPRLNPSLSANYEALDRVSPQLPGEAGVQDGGTPGLTEQAAPAFVPQIDDGEAVLNTPVWSADGGDTDLDDPALALALAGLDRGSAVDAGIDGIVAGL